VSISAENKQLGSAMTKIQKRQADKACEVYLNQKDFDKTLVNESPLTPPFI